MVIVFNKKNILNNIIILSLLLYIWVIQWLDLGQYANYVLALLFLIHIIKNKDRVFNSLQMVSTALLLLVYPMISYMICGGEIRVILRNVIRIAIPIMTVYFFAYLARYEPMFLIEKMKKLAISINAYLIVNVPVLIRQIGGDFSMSGIHKAGTDNPFKADLVCGLFGYNGTPMLALYTCFVLIFNIMYYDCFGIRKKKTFFTYNILLLFFSAYVSVENDNKGLFIVLTLYLVFYYMVTNIHSEKMKKG